MDYTTLQSCLEHVSDFSRGFFALAASAMCAVMCSVSNASIVSPSAWWLLKPMKPCITEKGTRATATAVHFIVLRSCLGAVRTQTIRSIRTENEELEVREWFGGHKDCFSFFEAQRLKSDIAYITMWDLDVSWSCLSCQFSFHFTQWWSGNLCGVAEKQALWVGASAVPPPN